MKMLGLKTMKSARRSRNLVTAMSLEKPAKSQRFHQGKPEKPRKVR